LRLAGNAVAPVHDRAEHIEGQGLYLGKRHLMNSLLGQTIGRSMSRFAGGGVKAAPSWCSRTPSLRVFHTTRRCVGHCRRPTDRRRARLAPRVAVKRRIGRDPSSGRRRRRWTCCPRSSRSTRERIDPLPARETRATTRLYLITPPALDPDRFAADLEEA